MAQVAPRARHIAAIWAPAVLIGAPAASRNVSLRILTALLGIVGKDDGKVEQRLFGPKAGATPYREAIGPRIALRDRWNSALNRLMSATHRFGKR